MTPSLPPALVNIFGKETLKSLQSEPYHRTKKVKRPKTGNSLCKQRCVRCDSESYRRKQLVRQGKAMFVPPRYSVEEALVRAGLV